MKYIILLSLFILASCGGKNGEKELKHHDVVIPEIALIGPSYYEIAFNTPYVEMGAVAKDQRDGALTDKIEISGEVNNQILGVYTLTYSVKDNSGNENSITRDVKIVDVIAPSLILNGNSYMEIAYNSSYGELGAIAIDDYDGNISSSVEIEGYVNTKLLGTYTISYTVEDSSGNESSASRTVVVKDVVKPILSLIGSSSIDHEVHSTYNDQGAIAYDDYEGDISNRIQVNHNLNNSVLGSYTYSYNVSDLSGNNADSISRTINIVDTTKPSITLVGNNPLQVELGSVYSDPGVLVSDNYDNGLVATELIRNIDMNTRGDYQIIFEVTDSSGNRNTITRDVQVRDTTPPVLTVNPEEIVYQLGSVPSDVDELEGVSATDLELDRIDVSESVGTGEGTTVITYTAYDLTGNSTVKTRTYKVLDLPFLSLAKESSPLLATSMGTIQRDVQGANYDMIISNNQLYEISDTAIYSSNASEVFSNSVKPIIYNEERLGKDRNTLYLIENGTGIRAIDISTEAAPLTPIHIPVPNIVGTYQVDKAMMTTKGLFFSVGNSIYFVANDQTTANLVVDISPASLSSRGLYWTATGKYLISFENSSSFPSETEVALYNVENSNIRTTLAEKDTIFLSGDPDYNNANNVVFNSDGHSLFISFDSSYTFIMDEAQIQTFDSLGSEEIYASDNVFNFTYRVSNSLNNFSHLENFGSKIYGIYNNGQTVRYQNSTLDYTGYPIAIGSSIGSYVYKMIHNENDNYVLFHRDTNGASKIGLLNISYPMPMPPLMNGYQVIRVYDTISKQEIDLTGEFQGMVKYNGDYYLMPDNSDPLFFYSLDSDNKLIKIKMPQ